MLKIHVVPDGISLHMCEYFAEPCAFYSRSNAATMDFNLCHVLVQGCRSLHSLHCVLAAADKNTQSAICRYCDLEETTEIVSSVPTHLNA